MPRFGMMFPGQGSQSVGMLSDLGESHPQVAETYAEAGEALGYDLAALVREGPSESLDRTERTQPALLAAGVATWRVWQARGGPQPDVLAGHSLGEYGALVCAGAIDFGDALRLVELRGRAMQDAVPDGEGAMAAVIGLGDEAVRAICAEAAGDEVVEAVNYNAPGQVVIAGHKAAVERAMARAKDKGAKLVKQLAVSVPSHCRLMRSAAERLHSHLSEIPLRQTSIPVLHNLDGQPRDDVDGIRKALVAQLENPVQWVRTVQAMNARITLECGPGKVLSGLVKRIDKQASSYPLGTEAGMAEALAAVSDTGE